MGVSVLGRNSDRKGDCNCNYCSPLPNPNPANWEILEEDQFGPYLVLKVKYPDCTNYEGVKILVFKCRIEDLYKQSVIDPHFGQDNLIYPIARFAPTAEGWRDAQKFAWMKFEEL